jgi:ribonuclease III
VCGFYPANVDVYELALTHKSQRVVVNGVQRSYERLEFLGDSILGAIITDFLYRRYPLRDEGFMTQIRSRIVGKELLSKISAKMGLDSLARLNLENNREKKSIREDLFEALVGAIYMDKGYAVAQKFVLETVIKTYVDFEELEAEDTDYKSRLVRYCQAKKIHLEFVLAKEITHDDKRNMTVELYMNEQLITQSTAFSKKRASQQASQIALNTIGVDDTTEIK